MGRQSKLVLLLLLSIGVCLIAQSESSTVKPALSLLKDDLTSNDISDEDVAANDLKSTKVVELPSTSSSSPSSKAVPKSTPVPETSTTTRKQIKEEYLQDLREAADHSDLLAEDLRFNKILPEKHELENSSSSNNKSEESYGDYEDDYTYDDDDYDEESTEETQKTTKASSSSKSKSVEMKPIEDKTKVPKAKATNKKSDNTEANSLNESVDDDDDYDEDEDEDEEDDEDDEDEKTKDNAEDEEVDENVSPCPRYCVCNRNVNSYLVATCSRLDAGTQKFGSGITDLVVTDVGPKYPILLGPKFFSKLGLKHVSSIKIANCTVEYLHPEAFSGLDELYAVNLTNVGLNIFNPETFAQHKKLRLLTLSGNDLSIMTSLPYILRSSSIEELDLSRNNLMDLSQNAFAKLSNIVYINLANNNIEKLPEALFDTLETIEELDLSYNKLKSLPDGIFNRTALAILHLKYNEFSDKFGFGNSDLQQLDLSYNSIQHVNHRMFEKMTGLTNLNLKGNGINKISPDSFLTLKNLRHIDLSMNQLDQISSMTFYKNSELDVIRLNDNPKLSQLPPDGFKSYSGYFTVYHFDISNCAVSGLGHNTFSTMPHLATLKLAWNNINNLERDTFQDLTKLTELDLSNNLIFRLDELMFMNNNDLVKLKLAGNPIEELSVRLFLPLNKLRDLDVSECDLSRLLSGYQYGVGRKYKFFETLRYFNASSNQIKSISSKDIKSFKNLQTLDIGHNPLQCDSGFQDFIRYVLMKTDIIPKKVPTMAEVKDHEMKLDNESPAMWGHFAREVCGHQDNEAFNKKMKTLDERLSLADKELTKDSLNLLNAIDHNDIDKKNILKDSLKKHTDEEVNTAAEDKDDEDDEDESEYDEDEDDDGGDDNGATNDKEKDEEKDIDYSKIKDHGVNIQEVDLSKETTDKFLKDKFKPVSDDSTDDDDEDDEDDDYQVVLPGSHYDRETYINHPRTGKFIVDKYNFLLMIAVFICVLTMMTVLAKCICDIRHKRGERYNLAMMNKQNSFVYQKLTEEIKPPVKEPKQPKVHRYAPINPV